MQFLWSVVVLRIGRRISELQDIYLELLSFCEQNERNKYTQNICEQNERKARSFRCGRSRSAGVGRAPVHASFPHSGNLTIFKWGWSLWFHLTMQMGQDIFAPV